MRASFVPQSCAPEPLSAGLVQPMFGAMGPYAGAFFYVVTITVERCAYSCGFMNPAVVFATHALKGGAHSATATRTTKILDVMTMTMTRQFSCFRTLLVS